MDTKKASWGWFIRTCLIAGLVLGLLFLLVTWPLIGLWTLLGLILFVTVGSVLQAKLGHAGKEDIDQKDLIRPLSERDLNNSQRLLRYATAVLAFLSLYSTAAGMQSFVFSAAWLAYLGSFAVQSILVVFSFLLCRFFIQIMLLKWPLYLKKLASCLLILFFCWALVMSSSFSYSYIANTAYEKSWSSDSETLIQKYLLEAAYRLREENEQRGDTILGNIDIVAGDRLSGVISAAQIQTNSELKQDLRNKIQSLPSFDRGDEHVAEVATETRIFLEGISVEAANVVLPMYNSNFVSPFVTMTRTYNQFATEVESWKQNIMSFPTASEIKEKIERIDQNVERLNTLYSQIEKLETYQLQRDFAPVRNLFQNSAITLQEHYGILKGKLQELAELFDQIEENTSNPLSGSLDNLLTQVYLLGVKEDITVEGLIEEITNLTVQASGNETLQTGDIQNLVALRDELTLYKDYLSLKDSLGGDDGFIQNRLKVTYQITLLPEQSDASPSDSTSELSDVAAIPQDDAAIEKKAVRTVSETEWKEIRNDDFNTFFTLVNLLPDMAEFSIETERPYESDYDATQELTEASNLRRDLLGTLTDFEKAFNYLKYPFPVMAYFSIVIALFFDLGAFFTGCFLYITEYIEKKSEDTEESNKTEDELSNGDSSGEEDELSQTDNPSEDEMSAEIP